MSLMVLFQNKEIVMGLLDGIASAVIGKLAGGQNGSVVQIAMELLNQNGGLRGILEKFNQSGLAGQAESWVSKGKNLPISADQINQALGSDQLADIAAKFGVSPDELSSRLAEYLPKAVDKLTPDGTVPTNESNILSQVLAMLK
jgi:uncharacterized protein YidB (DUF937 family)